MKKILSIFLILIVSTQTVLAGVGHANLYIRGGTDAEEHVYWGAHMANLKTRAVKNYGDFTDDYNFTSNTVQIAFSSGHNIGMLIGYQSGAWRFETDMSWWDSNHKRIEIDDVDTTATRAESGKGRTNVFSLMFNAYYDILDPNQFAVTPIVGTGFGFGLINTQIAQSIATTSANTKTAYNLIIGAALKASDDLTLQLLFRQFITKSAPNALINKPYKADAMEFGFRYNF